MSVFTLRIRYVDYTRESVTVSRFRRTQLGNTAVDSNPCRHQKFTIPLLSDIQIPTTTQPSRANGPLYLITPNTCSYQEAFANRIFIPGLALTISHKNPPPAMLAPQSILIFHEKGAHARDLPTKAEWARSPGDIVVFDAAAKK